MYLYSYLDSSLSRLFPPRNFPSLYFLIFSTFPSFSFPLFLTLLFILFLLLLITPSLHSSVSPSPFRHCLPSSPLLFLRYSNASPLASISSLLCPLYLLLPTTLSSFFRYSITSSSFPFPLFSTSLLHIFNFFLLLFTPLSYSQPLHISFFLFFNFLVNLHSSLRFAIPLPSFPYSSAPLLFRSLNILPYHLPLLFVILTRTLPSFNTSRLRLFCSLSPSLGPDK